MKNDSRFLIRPNNSAAIVSLILDGESIMAQAGDTVAAALLAHSGAASREGGKGSPRTAFCMMGVCFDCLIEVDGSPNTQGCMVQVRDGMVLRRPRGLRAFEGVVNDKSEPPVPPFDSAQGTAPCSTRGLSGAEARNEGAEMSDPEIIIIGAGPAGMAAAATAANEGAKVLLLDEQRQAGGQIYRNVGVNSHPPDYLGKDYAAGKLLVQALNHDNITAEFGATVWRIESSPDSPRVVWSRDGISHIAAAPHVLLAGGAQERPVPFPGWTLPGVMSAGAAQILMKTSGLLPRDAILTGSGPLLYLIAAQMIDAGAPPKALVETQTVRMLLGASWHLPRALMDAPTLFKGFSLLRKISAAGVKRYTSASGFHATAAEDGSLVFTFDAGGCQHNLVTPLLLTHQGVVPSTHLSRASGIAHEWNDGQGAFQPVTDVWGQTELPGFHVAGDGAGIGGAESAQAAGRLAAFNILHRLGRLSGCDRDQKAKADRAALNRALAVRPLLDALYVPPPEFLSPSNETVVCRCEEITAAEVRQSLVDGANGPRQVKTTTRAGMGPCQGRMCDLTVRGIMVAAGFAPALPRARTPVKPVKLGELAALKTSGGVGGAA